MVVACPERMVITNISFLILVIVLQFKESQYPFSFADLCKNHTSVNFFSPVIVKKILKTEKREKQK